MIHFDIVTPNDIIPYCVDHFVTLANQAIADHGYFAVALSGGSTPNAIYKSLSSPENRNRIDWSKVQLYWSDERAVPPDSPQSNYRAAMDAGFGTLPIKHIFRMEAENHIEEHALQYEKLLPKLDLVMLGMGEDGHTASLFPNTHALHSGERLVVANFIPKMDCWRMTFTFKCINAAKNIVIYVMGESKQEMLNLALTGPYNPDVIPIQRVGTAENKALLITNLKKQAG